MKVCLNLSGQIRLSENESLLDKIEYLKKFIYFDRIYMHVWKKDYLKYKTQIHQIQNTKVIIVDVPDIDKKFFYPNSTKIITPYPNKERDYVCEFYALQCVFQESNLEDNDIHIRCRYDSIFTKQLNLNALSDYLLKEEPVAIVPMGGDWHYGLGNVFYVMNKSAAWLMKSILFDVYKMCKSGIPFHPESLLRAHLKNYNDVRVYRMSFPVMINQNNFYFNETYLGDCIVEDKLKFISEYLQ